MTFAETTVHEVRDDRAAAYYNGYGWEVQVDIMVDALHACQMSLDLTAPALLRAWDRFENRHCE